MEETNIIEYTKEYNATNDVLTETSTPSEIVVDIKTYNIEDTKRKIAKINNAISTWEDRRAPLQAIIDMYNEIKPVEELVEPTEPEEPIE